MKKPLGYLIVPLILCLLLTACSGAMSVRSAAAMQSPWAKAARPQSAETPTLRIVATTFPQYDWVRRIMGDRLDTAEVTLLLDDGVDLHSFQPSVGDIAGISACDLFIHVGGISDTWVQGVLENAANPDRIVINLLEVLGTGAKTEELREGMEHSHEHDHEDAHEHTETEAEEHDHEAGDEHAVLDEHVWLSLKNARLFCARIAEALIALDPANAETYEANAKAYDRELAALDGEYQRVADTAAQKVLLFGDRFPFRYLTDDYGLTYYAAFAGCSAETEASFETIVFLSNTIEELGLGSILTIEGSDQSVAETIVRNTRSGDQAILTLDSMQSVTQKDMAAGATYLSVMEKNLAVFKQALQ